MERITEIQKLRKRYLLKYHRLALDDLPSYSNWVEDELVDLMIFNEANENKQPNDLQCHNDNISDNFKEAGKMLKETVMLMGLKHLLGEPESVEKNKNEKWIKNCGIVAEWLLNYK